ncbi:MAG: hypothetical protein IK057_05725 [Clostridia bacterium]|nr:hypothetical protein [Clostridia bacterium]
MFESPRERHVGTSGKSLVPIFYKKSELTLTAVPPLSQKVTFASAIRL